MAKKLRITLVRSLIGKSGRQRRTAAALGLAKKHETVERPDAPAIRGMIAKLAHVLSVEEV
jgi:large subunit ribosomal protein L30